ncbi:MAG: RNA polymerase sigma factor [Gemmatimonadetes bacterium]|nr:RNA polymerase sigma factor [Gemmatimonadota bacterium]
MAQDDTSRFEPAESARSDGDESLPPTQSVVERLVANHQAFLSYLERRVGDRDTAEDLLQDAFVRGLGRAPQRQDETLVPWFYRVLRNAVIDHYRRRGSAGRALEAFARELEATDEPDHDTDRALCRCVAVLAETLKPEYGEALRRVELDGVAVKDFAIETGISAGNAAVRVFRARDALRRQLVRSCGTCADHGCLDCSCRGGRPGTS